MNKLFIHLCLCLSFFGLAACSSYDYEEQNAGDPNGMHTVKMHLDGGISGYDDVGSRAAKGIADGTKFYIKFSNSVSGTAVYHSAQNEWSLTYNGTLASGTKTCSVYYIENPESETDSEVRLSSNTELYSATNGSYTISGIGSITVTAKLTPMLSRVRFKGERGTVIRVEGAKRYVSFAIGNCRFTSTNDATSLTVNIYGYTDYMYYYEPAEELTILNDTKKYVGKNLLKSSVASYVMQIPTESDHYGWTMTDRPIEPVAVDLGLSVKWATFNVGANYPEEYGDYYAWGETETKSSYSWGTYKDNPSSDGRSFTKYATDKKTVLDPEDDVAHVKWGGSWRMPTYGELDEIMTKCTWTLTIQNGVNGYVVTGPNGNSVFLPAAGYRYYGSLANAGSYGYYWASSLRLGNSNSAYDLYFNSGYVYWDSNIRCYGQSVRPVCP